MAFYKKKKEYFFLHLIAAFALAGYYYTNKASYKIKQLEKQYLLIKQRSFDLSKKLDELSERAYYITAHKDFYLEKKAREELAFGYAHEGYYLTTSQDL